jgi:hypothetical protein
MSDFEIERSITINAPASEVYPYINNLQAWQDWSPWEGIDPKLNRSYTGPQAGIGAGYGWVGNRKAGAGFMEITESEEPGKVVLALDFQRPLKTKNIVLFDLTEVGRETTVRWHMSGTNAFFTRFFSKLVNTDKLVGKDFEKGLAALRDAAEKK